MPNFKNLKFFETKQGVQASNVQNVT